MAVCKRIRHTSRFQDLTGKTFARLTVIEYAGRKFNKSQWRCICECGNEKIYCTQQLKSGATKSCGCLRAEMAGNRTRTHGMTEKSEFGIWMAIIGRCTNKNNECYQRYGGRGISICNRWRESFEAFYEDMGPRPSKDHAVERHNNDGNYEPSNCSWQLRAVQAMNTRTNRFIEYMGERRCLNEWARMFGQKRERVRDRLARGWTIGRALETPVRVKAE